MGEVSDAAIILMGLFPLHKENRGVVMFFSLLFPLKSAADRNFMMLTALSSEKTTGFCHWSLRSGDCVLQVSFFVDN